jgi:acid phosphatase class B
MSMKITITAVALVAALAVPAMAANDSRAKTRAIHYVQKSSARASVDSVFDADARSSYNSPPQFSGYPTDYLMNRFGDRQMQGR